MERGCAGINPEIPPLPGRQYITREANHIQRGVVTIEAPINSTLRMKPNQVQPSQSWIFFRIAHQALQVLKMMFA